MWETTWLLFSLPYINCQKVAQWQADDFCGEYFYLNLCSYLRISMVLDYSTAHLEVY